MANHTDIPDLLKEDFIAYSEIEDEDEAKSFLLSLQAKWAAENMPARLEELLPQLIAWFDTLKLEANHLMPQKEKVI